MLRFIEGWWWLVFIFGGGIAGGVREAVNRHHRRRLDIIEAKARLRGLRCLRLVRPSLSRSAAARII